MIYIFPHNGSLMFNAGRIFVLRLRDFIIKNINIWRPPQNVAFSAYLKTIILSSVILRDIYQVVPFNI